MIQYVLPKGISFKESCDLGAKVQQFYVKVFEGVKCPNCTTKTYIYLRYGKPGEERIKARVSACCSEFKKTLHKTLTEYVKEWGRYNSKGGYQIVH